MVDNHFTVTIHDDNGVKQFNVHKFIKKAFLYAGLFLLSIVLIASGTILYLNASVDKLQSKKNEVAQAYKEMLRQNQALQKEMKSTTHSLLAKEKELDELSDSLSQIETLIGLKPLADESLAERVNMTMLSSSHRATLLELIPSGSPVKYHGITSKFGYRIHPTLHKKEFHRGSDMKAKFNTPVYATADGIVEWAGLHRRSGFGKLVILEHVYGFKSYFGHLNKIVVKSGQFVKKGDLLAYTGNSGLSNGPHLHYEIRFIHRALNPYYFIKWTQQNYNEIFKKEKKVPWQSLIMATSRIKVIKQMQTQQLSQPEQKSKAK
ncbi:peptidoglycan DD-metalloendopeptidase family protein [Sulfurimonas sp. SWIR-19]|uniref:peptidoglycan DD-metalloendopeptidase family protein n=1 Tax=Sulfurimonas sp. SWIR-19 TaxID=2878390 RepID=UPI001CF2EEE1|nr:peptidoglycan DD-metalloendopeptidase family protein [Sulfurimonas sp. SWIR-19]UCN00911.1 peptidoglycan DD-metalloendopeptidase family protein [Sulfurimonas sp. SWIR-19]